ncbi:MAG: hypothetical protein AB1742_13790, partial [bacterium]
LLEKAKKGIPDALISVAEGAPLYSAPVVDFMEANGLSLPCEYRLHMFSVVLDATVPLLRDRRIEDAGDAMRTAVHWRGNCEPGVKLGELFAKFKSVYRQMSGTPFAEMSIAAGGTEEGRPVPEREASPRRRFPDGVSVLRAVGDLFSGFTKRVTALFSRGKESPGVPVKAPGGGEGAGLRERGLPAPVIPAGGAAEEKAPLARAEEGEVGAAPVPAGDKEAGASRKEARLVKSLRSDIAGLGVRVMGVEFAGEGVLRVAFGSQKVGTNRFADELKTVFEIIHTELVFMEMVDEVEVVGVRVFSWGGEAVGAWDVRMEDYRVFRQGKMSGDEFVSRWKKAGE